MSIYRCTRCEQYKDADLDGCNQYLDDELTELCDDCETSLREEEFKASISELTRMLGGK